MEVIHNCAFSFAITTCFRPGITRLLCRYVPHSRVTVPPRRVAMELPHQHSRGYHSHGLPTLQYSQPPNVAIDTVSVDTDSRFAKIDGVEVHHKVFQKSSSTTKSSTAPVAVCIHGFGASLFSYEICDRLTDHFTAVAYDSPGFGFTSRPSQLLYYSARFSARIANTLAKAYTPHNPHIVIAHSMGALAAVHATYAQPKRIQALILIAPAIVPSSLTQNWLTRLAILVRSGLAAVSLFLTAILAPLLVFLVRRVVTPESFWRRGLRFSRSPRSHLPEPVISGYRRPITAPSWEKGIINFSRAALKQKITESIGGYDYVRLLTSLGPSLPPILVVHGRDDVVVPLNNSKRIVSALPGARLVIMENCGHVPHEENPQAFSQVVVNFCKDIAIKDEYCP